MAPCSSLQCPVWWHSPVSAAANWNVTRTPHAVDDELTPKEDVTSYNNFYEFGTGKSDPKANSKDFEPLPWSVSVSGHCDKPGTYHYEDLVSPHQLEERIYRFRCVEVVHGGTVGGHSAG